MTDPQPSTAAQPRPLDNSMSDDTPRATHVDIGGGERQYVAEELAAKSAALQITLDSMDQGILSLDVDGRVNFFNQRLVELLDLPEALLLTRPTMEQIAQHQASHGHFGPSNHLMGDTARPYLDRWLQGERPRFPLHYYRRTITGRMLEVKTRYLDGKQMVRTFSDVTDYFDAQQRLIESQAQESKLALVAAHTDNIVIIADAGGRIEWVNQAFTTSSGYSLEEAMGRRVPDLLRDPATDPLEAARFDSEIKELGRSSAELLNRARDGRTHWVAIEARAVQADDGTTRQYISVARDISERKRVEAALVSARLEAERANRAKSDFLSSMSHELRTPMNAILGFAQLIAVDGAEQLDRKHRSYVREIQHAGQHLLDLINDVLDLSSVESGGQALSIEAVPLHELVDDSVRLLQPLARQHQVRFGDTAAIDNHLHVLADRRRLTQVLLNLLSNAVKYNREGGLVTLSCEADDAQVTCRVTDTGPGLSVDQQSQLFRAFERLGAQEGHVQGAGIGLVLTRRLIELMGGSIGVDSELGKGTTFRVRLPRAAEPVKTTGGREDSPPAATGHLTAAAAHDVLYIEDNPVNVVLVEAMLAQASNFQVRSALDPLVGLELAWATPPSLILLDIQLPGIDGFEVLKRLRAHPSTQRVPVVAISANAMPVDVERGKAAGFDAYLVKPIDMHELHATMGPLLSR